MEGERNGIIRRYVINITELNSGNEYQLENASTEITIPDLHPFYRYSYSVAAETVALGPFTPGSIIEMPEDGKLINLYHAEGMHINYIMLKILTHLSLVSLQHPQLHPIILLPQMLLPSRFY